MFINSYKVIFEALFWWNLFFAFEKTKNESWFSYISKQALSVVNQVRELNKLYKIMRSTLILLIPPR